MTIDSSKTPVDGEESTEAGRQTAVGGEEASTSPITELETETEAQPQTESDAAPDVECPKCEMVSPGNSTVCWNCAYNFVTGQAHVEPKAQAHAPSQTARELTAPVVDEAVSQVLVPTSAGGVVAPSQPRDAEGATKAETGQPMRRTVQPSPDAVVYAVAMPTQAAAPGDKGAATATAAPVVSPAPRLPLASTPAAVTARGAAPVGGDSAPASVALGVESSAVSIPAMNIVHPSTPHVVLLVDLEARRSRPSTDQTPPAREPLVVALTGEAQAFGRSIKSCCLDFDRAASGLHGFFQSMEQGGYAIRDESSNGTKLNGTYLEKGMATVLKNGDVITLGVWTKIIYWDGISQQKEDTTGGASSTVQAAGDPASDGAPASDSAANQQ